MKGGVPRGGFIFGAWLMGLTLLLTGCFPALYPNRPGYYAADPYSHATALTDEAPMSPRPVLLVTPVATPTPGLLPFPYHTATKGLSEADRQALYMKHKVSVSGGSIMIQGQRRSFKELQEYLSLSGAPDLGPKLKEPGFDWMGDAGLAAALLGIGAGCIAAATDVPMPGSTRLGWVGGAVIGITVGGGMMKMSHGGWDASNDALIEQFNARLRLKLGV